MEAGSRTGGVNFFRGLNAKKACVESLCHSSRTVRVCIGIRAGHPGRDGPSDRTRSSLRLTPLADICLSDFGG